MDVTHVLESIGDRYVLCGERRDRVPRVWAPFVQAHRDGRGLVLCADCREVAERESISFEP